ncbi:MAG: hypothetical protein HC897_16380, partial [Thermoanaerobaculia bacterium]|nr:hypothetical protein [Thermoanaerobaculia bacterium]
MEPDLRQLPARDLRAGLDAAVHRRRPSPARARRARPQAIAGGETAGIPFASYLAAALGLPLVYVRKKPKDYGIASRVEGRLERGARVVLVEDLITDGGSKLGFLDALAEVGGEVGHAVVLFDREQGGREMLAERGVALHAV